MYYPFGPYVYKYIFIADFHLNTLTSDWFTIDIKFVLMNKIYFPIAVHQRSTLSAAQYVVALFTKSLCWLAKFDGISYDRLI